MSTYTMALIISKASITSITSKASKTSMTSHFCYIIINESKKNTYVGYTVKPDRRIRQHNGEIKGGAKYTSRHGPNWSFVALITSNCASFDNHLALSLEWHMKPHRKKMKTNVENRVALLAKALMHPKMMCLDHVSIAVAPAYYDLFKSSLAHLRHVYISLECQAISCLLGRAENDSSCTGDTDSTPSTTDSK